ncbi:MAG TPA: FAD-binding oxidoreductase, partial [Paenirhodobacter sp.]
RMVEQTPALRLNRHRDGVVIDTPGGVVRAQHVILATDAYSRLTGATIVPARGIVRVQSAIIATETLPRDIAARISPNGRPAFDTRRVLRYWRIVDGRMLFGGDGVSGRTTSTPAFENLRRSMLSIYPELEPFRIEHRWSGFLGMTPDALPHLGHFDDRVHFVAGFNGTGVALSSLLGRYIARMSLGEMIDVALLDARRFRTVPFPVLHPLAVQLVARTHALKDRLGR